MSLETPHTSPVQDHRHCKVNAHILPSDLAEIHCSIEKRLTIKDQRYTKARRRVVEVLFKSERPLTLPEIVASDAQLAQSSTYRNLDLLVQVEAVERVISAHDHTHFELSQELIGHHHHLICIECGLILDIELKKSLEQDLTDQLTQIGQSYGFSVTGHQLDIEGHCGDCDKYNNK